MSMKIRLARGGSKKRPFYSIVATDSRMPRDGRFLEKLGTYNPLLAKDDENRVKMDLDRVKHWLGQGAQPTDRIARMLEAAGVKNVNTYDYGYEVGMGIHEMGTARMGKDPKTSVLNGNNQVWDAPNVFVTDGACMTSASCVNPSLTYMAMTARAADYAASFLTMTEPIE